MACTGFGASSFSAVGRAACFLFRFLVMDFAVSTGPGILLSSRTMKCTDQARGMKENGAVDRSGIRQRYVLIAEESAYRRGKSSYFFFLSVKMGRISASRADRWMLLMPYIQGTTADNRHMENIFQHFPPHPPVYWAFLLQVERHNAFRLI